MIVTCVPSAHVAYPLGSLVGSPLLRSASERQQISLTPAEQLGEGTAPIERRVSPSGSVVFDADCVRQSLSLTPSICVVIDGTGRGLVLGFRPGGATLVRPLLSRTPVGGTLGKKPLGASAP